MTRFLLRGAPGAGLLSLTLLLAACGEDKPDNAFSLSDQAWSNAFANQSGLPPLPDAQPMAIADAGAPVAAPSVERLPAAAPIRYARPQGDDYAWIDRADMFSDALGDAPPDYGFAYEDGVQPWAWQSGDDYLRYAEPIDGGYRYYYYEPGGASPYLVRDPWNSYGYRGDQLVAVYDRGGRVMPWREARGRDAYAARYYARAVDMRRAARARERERIEARQWAARRAAIRQDRLRWDEARREQADWRRYRARQDVRAQQHWAAERRAREQAAVRFARWQREDFRGPQPLWQQQRQRDRVRAQQQLTQQQRDRRMRQERAEVRRDAADQRVALMQRRAEQRRDAARDEQRRATVRQMEQRRETQRAAQARVDERREAQQRRSARVQVAQQREVVERQAQRQTQRQAQARRQRVEHMRQQQAHKQQQAQAAQQRRQAARERAGREQAGRQQAARQQAQQARVERRQQAER